MIRPTAHLGTLSLRQVDELVAMEAPKVGSLHPLELDFVHAEVAWHQDPVVVTGHDVQVRVLDTWERHGGGHVVRFRVESIEFPRLLGRRSGYSVDPSKALQGEPEPIDSTTQDGYSLEADQTALLEGGRREQERREHWSRADRIRRAEQLARRAGVDVSSDLRVIDIRLDAIERKLGRRAA